MFPTMVRCRVRSTHSSTTCPSSSTAMRDSCFAALMTISRDIDAGVYPERRVRSLCIPRINAVPQIDFSEMLTLYFAGAISGGRDDVALYREIIEALEG